MKITIKTLQQTVFQIDADGEETIGQLKEKIFEAKEHPVASQKLIYSGRVLPDSKTLASCEIKEKDFLVLMVAKPRPPFPPPSSTLTATTLANIAPPPSSATASTAPVVAPTPPAPTVTQPAAPSEVVPAPAPALASASAPAPAPAPTAPVPSPTAQTTQPDTAFVTGDALQTAVQNMMEMGFDRDQVQRALRASFNNPDRAVEYLFNGIPEQLELPPAPAQSAPPPAAAQAPAAPTPAPAPAPGQRQNLFQLAQQQQQQQQQQGGGGVGAGAGLGGPGGLDLSALRDNPQIAQLRELVAQNPAMLQQIIQQLGASNPQLGQMLASNPQMLHQLLAGEEGDGEGMQVVSITQEEQAAIERLEALGFPRQAVIQAYFACDKNEELAANYLFENGWD